MLAMPVSSSSVRKTNPLAVPGRCRVMTAPATRTRRPCRPRGRSIARSTPRSASSVRRSASGCGPIVRLAARVIRHQPLGWRHRLQRRPRRSRGTRASVRCRRRRVLDVLPREQLPCRPHRSLDLPQRAAAVVAERVQRADFRQRRQLVAAHAVRAIRSSMEVNRSPRFAGPRIRGSRVGGSRSVLGARELAERSGHVALSPIRARRCCRSRPPSASPRASTRSSQPHFGQR